MKRKHQKFKIGDKVQSRYAAGWHGIVKGIHWIPSCDKKSQHAIYSVLPIITVDGRKQRKPKIHTLNGHWLKPSNMDFEA
jgi:hypothetical protein